MFTFLALLSSLGYITQSMLMVRWGRGMSPLLAGMVRSLSLIVTFSPILFLTRDSFLWSDLDFYFWINIFIAGTVVVFAQWMILASRRYLPAAVGTATDRGLAMLYTSIIGMIFLGDHITYWEWGAIFLTIIGISAMMVGKMDTTHVKNLVIDYPRGFLLQGMGTIILFTGVIIITHLSRVYDPAITAWLWESSIGVMTVPLVLGFYVFKRSSIDFSEITLSRVFSIALCASPTLIGTGSFIYAIQQGSVGAFNTIGSIIIAVSGILGWWLYNEKLNVWQWVGILTITTGVVGVGWINL